MTSGLGTSHPLDKGFLDPRTGGLMACTSTCRRPHTVPNPELLRYPGGGRLCLTCHEEIFHENT